MRRILYLLGLLVLLIVLYLLFWPVPFDPAGWTPPEPPAAEGVYAENDLLTAAEIIAEDYVGPEAIARDSEGLLYTGLEDGRIIRMDMDGENVEVFAEAVEPLGMKFDAEGNLIVADAIQGILSINPDGEVTILIAAGEDEDFFYLNDLDIAADGKIYFSHASSKFHKAEYVLEAMEHRPHGSFWVYDPETGETTRLIDEMYFPNGVALSPDDDFVLVNELNMYRVWRYWLTGELAGEAEIFIDNLPGFPDNITSNGEDTFWLALSSGPVSRATLDGFLPNPFLTRVAMRLPEAIKPAPTLQGYILGLDHEGNVIYNLQDLEGAVYAPTASATEYDGMLYIGSFLDAGIARIPVPEQRLSGE